MVKRETVNNKKEVIVLVDNFSLNFNTDRIERTVNIVRDNFKNVELKVIHYTELNVGNLKNRKFKEIWLNSKVFNLLRDRSKLKGACSICEFREICGGCRARANAYGNDILSSDPGCIIAKKREINHF